MSEELIDTNLDTELDEDLTPLQKVSMWHEGTRNVNVRACSPEKLNKYRSIAVENHFDDVVTKIDAEMRSRGMNVPQASHNVRSIFSFNEEKEFDLLTELEEQYTSGKLTTKEYKELLEELSEEIENESKNPEFILINTATGKEVKPGDYLLLKRSGISRKIEKIEYPNIFVKGVDRLLSLRDIDFENVDWVLANVGKVSVNSKDVTKDKKTVLVNEENVNEENLEETYSDEELDAMINKTYNQQKVLNIYRRTKYNDKRLFAHTRCIDCGREKRVFLSNLVNDPEKYGSCVCSDTNVDSKMDHINDLYSGKKKLSSNTSGYTGVSYVKNYSGELYDKWRAYIDIDGHRHFLGDFDSKAEAVRARKEAAEKGIKWYKDHKNEFMRDTRKNQKRKRTKRYKAKNKSKGTKI